MNNRIITIGRQYAAGGRQTGEMLAQRLGFEFFDRELIKLAAKESGLCTELYEKADEKKRFSLFHGLFNTHSPSASISNNYINGETLFKIQSDVIRSLAGQKNCVFVGRCSDYILRDRPNVLNVFISADTPERIKRLRERENLPHSTDALLELLAKTDRKRADFYNYFTSKQWGVAASYHLSINSSLLGIEHTVDTVCRVAEMFFK